ncbi:MAG: DoxX family protein [Paludibacteraceae bacterium]|nr:DoxX family protein [Paludibacteraceae bacterium]MBO7316455.1 DoxX family protein [Paludibacteraceae bacterium]
MKKRATRKHNKGNNSGVFVRVICQIILGISFAFSGFVKAIDPLGSTYKIEDYLTAFGPFFEHFAFLAFPLSVLLAAVEFTMGVNFLLGANVRLTKWIALFFMLVMTPLTLYIALENPVTDCGCFGDAIVLSNWATFWKNIGFSLLVLLLFVLPSFSKNIYFNYQKWIITSVAFSASVLISIYCLRHLPIIDFRPYKIGTDIVKSMEVPEGAKSDVYETTFIYAKDGVEKEFTLANFPDENDGWVFIEQKTTLIEKGYEPPIHDFSIVNAMGDDITYEVLEKEGFTFLLIAYDVNKAEHKFNEKIASINQLAQYGDIDFYALTASVDEDIEKYSELANATYEWCKTDPITLKTIIRANPGLVLIKDGIIIGKWNSRDIPSAKEMQEEFLLQNN